MNFLAAVETMTQIKRKRKEGKKAPPAARKPVPGRDGRRLDLRNAGDGKNPLVYNSNAGALESLLFSEKLNDVPPAAADDKARADAHIWGQVRRHTLQSLDLNLRMAQGSPVKSVDWGKVGHSGFGPVSFSAARLEATRAYSEMMAILSAQQKTMVESVLIHDRSFWEKVPVKQHAQALEPMRLALDMVAYEIRSKMHREIGKCVGPARMESRWPKVMEFIRSKAQAKHRAAQTNSGNMAAIHL